jgi:hypothetical protein
MKIATVLLLLTAISLATGGCQANIGDTPMTLAPTATITPSPGKADKPLPTHTVHSPTKAPTSTITPLSPSPIPQSPTTTPEPTTDTVCASGCDFSSIQAVLNDLNHGDRAVIEIQDPIHTEAGIVVDQSVTIRGLGVDRTVIQAHEKSAEAPERIFLIEQDAEVRIENITLRHGKPSNAAECGGAIMNYGTLVLTQVVVSENIANSGGGICNSGTLTLTNSSVSQNTADGEGPEGYTCGAGGGIKCERGSLILINSLVNGNQSMDADPFREVGVGGGIHIGCNCSATITNSTISGNRSVKLGGGIFVHGDLELINCTITDNITKGEAGGVYVRGHMDYMNTIIADNTGQGGSCIIGGPGGYKGEGSIGGNTNNLVRGGNCNPDFSDKPMLGPLADNGGDTLTHALLPGSPAIDIIPASSCTLPTDQRGLPRPVSLESASTPCDIGAFEVQYR